jgi:hypothetical protein
MSYCRFIEADAYIYDDVYYGLICCACSMGVDGNFIAGYDYDLMLEHIAQHRQQKDFIPLDVDERLRLERDCKHGDVEKTNYGPRCTICWRVVDG